MQHRHRIVRIGPGEVEQAASMHRRCSPHTLWSRYHRAMGDPRSYLRTLLGRPDSVHLAAVDAAGGFAALGHLMPDGDRAEAALLVEDAWQNQGLGTLLLRDLGEHAVRTGRRAVYGLLLPGDRRVQAILRRAAVPVRSAREQGVVTAWVDTRDLPAAVHHHRDGSPRKALI